MTRVSGDRNKRSILSDVEFEKLIAQARVNDCSFLSIRNPAILCTLRIFGKRREEIASLKYPDVWVDSEKINFNFILLKKHRARAPEVVRSVLLKDPLVPYILTYKKHLDSVEPDPLVFWPQVYSVFGHDYVVNYKKGIGGRTIYNVVRGAGDKTGIAVWPHLFRETAGGEEAREDPTLYGIRKVMNRLNVTERTAWAYMDRHVLSVVKPRYKQEEKNQNE